MEEDEIGQDGREVRKITILIATFGLGGIEDWAHVGLRKTGMRNVDEANRNLKAFRGRRRP